MLTIGEKINGSIKSTAEAINKKDILFLKDLADKQLKAGADFIDVNVGTGKNESETMKWLIGELINSGITSISIDTADEEVLKAALQASQKNKSLIINSITAEEKRLKSFLPYVKEFNTDVVALVMGSEGVPKNVEPRIKNCETIYEACKKEGIDTSKILFDPLIVPQATDQSQCTVTLKTIELIKTKYPETKICLGLSNLSFGLPLRKLVNTTFIAMAISRGADAALLNPLDQKLMSTIKAAEMIMGKDKFCKNYIKSFRNNLLVY